MEQNNKLLEYVPFSSSVNPSFWHKLTEFKLDVDKLNENKRNIWGSYSNLCLNSSSKSLFEVDSTSFNTECCVENMYLPYQGVILNKNTIEQFKDCNKNELIQDEAKRFWEYLKSEDALNNPSLLNFFFILSFADIKSYNYYYWFCFPAPPKISVNLIKINQIPGDFSENSIDKLYKSYSQLRSEQKTFFLVKKSESDVHLLTLKNLKEINSSNLSNYLFAFSDPSCSSLHPGWPLRNYVAFLLHHCPVLSGSSINILAFRLNRTGNEINAKNSLIFAVTLPNLSVEDVINPNNIWMGWERNERGKFGPRLCNMKNSIDPKCLAESAVDLNLKLMKWQLIPDIDLDKIKSAKCLLLGAGTLGCSVARNLLAWGVRHMTFLDSGYVSYSNPVRQNLYTYEDCVKNKTKAEAAAENVRNIFPGVTSRGFHLSIPMPGHPVGEAFLQQTKENVQILESLISEHDIIFLLMDSRESRWLPTLLGAVLQKVVINAALGFDTYLVMRHGFKLRNSDEEQQPGPSSLSAEGLKCIPGTKLGCYFCNDVTAPGNSLKDRTLDQQCTVTRPGVSAIAGALAVELAVSILQHPNGAQAPAFYKIGHHDFIDQSDRDDCILGILPHSVRGFLSSYNHVLPATEKYKQCVACSEIVIQEYCKDGIEFLLKVFDSCRYLEELTGLSEIQNEITDLEVWDLEDDESD